MELTTRCTHCQHQFQTTIHALQRRKGYVRCQQCGTIFDGFDAVVDDAQPQEERSDAVSFVAPAVPLVSVQDGLCAEPEHTGRADNVADNQVASFSFDAAPTFAYTHDVSASDSAEEALHATHTGLGQQGQVNTQADQLWAVVQHNAQEQFRAAADNLPQVIHLGRRKAVVAPAPIPFDFAAEETVWSDTEEATSESDLSIDASTYAFDDGHSFTMSVEQEQEQEQGQEHERGAALAHEHSSLQVLEDESLEQGCEYAHVSKEKSPHHIVVEADVLTLNEPSWHISEAASSHERQATPNVIRHRAPHSLRTEVSEPYLSSVAVEHEVQGAHTDEPFYADAALSATAGHTGVVGVNPENVGLASEDDSREPTFSMPWADATELHEPVIALHAEPLHSKTVPPTLWQRLVALFWRLCVMALLTLALLQTVYVYRNQIANGVPLLRIPLMLLCKSLGCDISYERQPKFIHELSSRLEELSHRPGEGYRYALKLALRNSYHRPQEWPDLAIRFKRSATSEIETHSFSPEQYLTPTQRRKPFAANSDAEVVLPLASTQRITHYDIYFYFH